MLVVVGSSLLVLTFLALQAGKGPLARYSLEYYRFLSSHFAQSLSPGIIGPAVGPLLSPAKSLFLFSPPTLLGLAGLFSGGDRAWRLRVPTVFAAFSLFVAQALFYREAWAGAVGWGLRFTLPVLPPLLMMSAPVVDRLLEGQRGRLGLYLILGVGMLIQVAGTLVPWTHVYSSWVAQGLDPFVADAAWDMRFLAIPFQVEALFHPSTWDAAWVRLLHEGSVFGVILAGTATVVAVCLSLGLGRINGQPRAGWELLGALALVSFLLPSLPAGWALRKDPAFGGNRPEFASTWEMIAAERLPTDVVIVDSYGTPLWSFLMNRWPWTNRWYSLPYEIPDAAGPCDGNPCPPSEASMALLETLLESSSRVWYLNSSETPDFSLHREEAWLDANLDLVSDWSFSGLSTVVVGLYSPR